MNDQTGLTLTDKADWALTCTVEDSCPGSLSHSLVSGLNRLREEVETTEESTGIKKLTSQSFSNTFGRWVLPTANSVRPRERTG
jgi:hypothetical protein